MPNAWVLFMITRLSLRRGFHGAGQFDPGMRVATVTAILVALVARCTADPVLVPGGYRANSENIHEIPAGGSLARVGSETRILAANGSIVHVAPVGTAPTKPKCKSQWRSLTSRFVSGWVAFAFWHNTAGSPISSFATTWEVPPVPATNNGQTVFLFNGIEPSAEDAILQPVLQYGPSGAGGGAFWAVASWLRYVGPLNTFHTTLVPVSAGTTLTGVMSLTNSNTNASSATFDYTSEFTNVPGTLLTITGIPELTAPVETLEAYSITAGTDYPVGATRFANVTLRVASGVVPDVAWSLRNEDAADGVDVSVEVDGATDARVLITY
ncbi:hypothetical protein C8R46DRAFT_1272211 [Mycena filopes]|nr:hypothetical protein C8R46DRAFT_1272211 [Mycena filopes]